MTGKNAVSDIFETEKGYKDKHNLKFYFCNLDKHVKLIISILFQQEPKNKKKAKRESKEGTSVWI